MVRRLLQPADRRTGTDNAAEQALKRVVKFIEGGGELDIDVAPGEEPGGEEERPAEESERVELRAMMKGIRKDIKLLPAGALGVDEEGSTGEQENKS